MRKMTALCALVALFALPLTADSPEPADLFAAARGGDAGEVARLLEAGVLVDSTNRYGASAILMAAGNGHLEVIELLLEKGADADKAEAFYGSTPVGSALFNSQIEAAKLLLRHGAEGREQALGFAVNTQNWDLVEAVVAAGPIYASVLERLRPAPGEYEELAKLLESAKARPDPEPPVYEPAELRRFSGLYEGWNTDLTVQAEVVDGVLMIGVNRAGKAPAKIVGENRFALAGDSGQARFFGRAGTIEGLSLRRGPEPPVSLRRSVAELIDSSELAAHLARVGQVESTVTTVNWPAFRGTNADGIGDGIDTPVSWDVASGKSVRWATDIPGLGNSSPVVWGDRVFITTAVAKEMKQEIRTGLTGDGSGVDEFVEHSWRVIALDKATGEVAWSTEVGKGVPLTRRHFKATQANSTAVTDGEYIAAVFATAGLVCLDMDGKILWKQELGGLNAGAFTDPGIQWGFAASPILHGTNVILQVDIHDGAYLAAWDLETGKEAWRTERDVAPSWATPSILAGPDGDELVVNGSTIYGYDAETGKELWSLGPNSELVIATPVISEGVAYVSAGYPPVKPIYAVRAGTRGRFDVDPGRDHERLVWSHNRGGAYMPTPLLYRGLFYVVHHNGRLVAYEPNEGAAVLKSRFSKGGTFTGSPVAVNGKLYIPTEEGLMYVLAAGPKYEEIAVNDFGEPLMATPAVSEGMLFVRTPSRLIALANDPAG